MPTTTESDNMNRRDDSPSSIEAIKRAVGISPSRRNRQQRNNVARQNRFRLKEDYRGRLPLWLSRFIGYRRPADKAPHDPIGPLSFLRSIPLKYEVWFFGWIGSFVGILLIEAIMTTNTAFRDLYHVPIIVASFGATAVLVFGATDSPLAQPRNVFGGQVISAIVGVAITRLFAMDPAYINHLGNTEFHPAPFINGAICMATALLAMSITGTIHPPAGATALIAAIELNATRLSWRYIPVVMSSACIMLGWALLINNLGRRKYPQYWWVSQRCFVVENAPGPTEDEEMAIATSTENPARQAEDGGRTKEALQQERMQGIGGNRRDMEDAVARAGRAGRPM